MRETMAYNPCFFQLRGPQLERMLEIVRATDAAEPGGVVFYGDSLTQLFPVERLFPELPGVQNCGVAGAVSEELLWLADEAVIKRRPRLVVLMVGTNDLGNTVMASPRVVACNVRDLVDLVLGNLPEARVLLWSPLPCVEELDGYRAKPCARSNDLLRMILGQERELIRDGRVSFLDVFDAFLDEQGRTRAELYADGLHLTEEGFRRLADLMRPSLLSIGDCPQLTDCYTGDSI